VTRPPRRKDGYVPIEDYAAIGDGRTVALVAGDGAIDWWCLPDLDSASVFGALLDRERGGSFRLEPAIPFEADRRYLPGTNVLETSFHTERGSVSVTDALTLPLTGLSPTRELTRSIKGLAGSVPMKWSAAPRFDYATAKTRVERRGSVAVASTGAQALAFSSWSAGEPGIEGASIGSSFEIGEGGQALLVAGAAHGQPLVFPSRAEAEQRLGMTIEYWREWSRNRLYEGRCRDAVIRSALALKLLIHSPSGAMAAAATTSLPEALGEERNWDYRFSWIRDASASLEALLSVGCPHEGDAFFWWMLHASQLTHPQLEVLYRLNGRTSGRERELALAGYRGSRPVRSGNGAASQTQLDVYGHLLQTAWLYTRVGGELSGDARRRLAGVADLVCVIWRDPDSGIWEVRGEPQHFTQSKMMCWVALDRAQRLAAEDQIPSSNVGVWRREAAAIRSFVAERCWSEKLNTYVRAAGSEETDASLLLGVVFGYGGDEERERFGRTADRIRADLGSGPLVRRYLSDDGLAGDEGAFLACSFWLVDALARLGRGGEAAELMEALLARANDVGLYAEEIDPVSGGFLGNFPQALVHLALINAAVTLNTATTR
jgi:GH15 family glucan-1,4-alpha-glucosidase